MTAETHSATPRLAGTREFRSAVVTIMVKELRSRMRGRRAFVVLTIYLSVLALIAWGSYTVISPAVRTFDGFGGMSAVDASARIGQAIFTVLSLFQLLLVCFIAPAFTAGTISLEREKQTLDLLISTPLRPGAIVVGKLLAALAFIFLMILAAIPLSALVLMYGGAGVDDILRQQIVLLATALGLGAVGLFWSALLKRTQAATVLTYCTMLALTIGTLLLFTFWTALLIGSSDDRFGRAPAVADRAPEQLVYLNPLIAMSDVIANTEIGGYGDFSRVISELRGTPLAFGGQREMVCDSTGDCFPIGNVDPGHAMGQVIVAAECPPGARCPLPPDAAFEGWAPGGLLVGHFWPRFTLTFGLMALLLTFASMRLVVPAGMRFVFGRRHHGPAAEHVAIRLPGEGEASIEPIEDPK